jgi:hypothetical protein
LQNDGDNENGGHQGGSAATLKDVWTLELNISGLYRI